MTQITIPSGGDTEPVVFIAINGVDHSVRVDEPFTPSDEVLEVLQQSHFADDIVASGGGVPEGPFVTFMGEPATFNDEPVTHSLSEEDMDIVDVLAALTGQIQIGEQGDSSVLIDHFDTAFGPNSISGATNLNAPAGGLKIPNLWTDPGDDDGSLYYDAVTNVVKYTPIP